jgi:hypothetical protein
MNLCCVRIDISDLNGYFRCKQNWSSAAQNSQAGGYKMLFPLDSFRQPAERLTRNILTVWLF